jgi:hypothetical protein
MGSAAAMQALKMFTGGQSGNSQGGNSQNAFIGMAMGQASKVRAILALHAIYFTYFTKPILT